MDEGGSWNEAFLSEETQCEGPLGRAPLLGIREDMLRKVLDTGISLHRDPVGELGGDSLVGTYERKGLCIWVPFLDPKDIKILSLGAIWNFGKETGLS
jgi:hypothetical protein